MAQTIINQTGGISQLGQILKNLGCSNYLLVCDNSFPYLSIRDEFDRIPVEHVLFDRFTPNPLYEDICNGVDLFHREGCDAVVAVGGGSAIDVAKCIKLYCGMDPAVNYLQQECRDSGVPLIAIPTTAGTGSESTRYAAIYFQGNKQSVAHESIVPNYAILEPGVLKTLPLYQKKCTLLDALCQGIESWWSVNSTEESKGFSKAAVETILRCKDAYLTENGEEAAQEIMTAANAAGRAINITQTTAAHAMSYKLTSMYGLPHGHAVAICLPHIWAYMIAHPQQCIDPRGEQYLQEVFDQISRAMGAASPGEAVGQFRTLLQELAISDPETDDATDIDRLGESVNPVRLKNNPIYLSEQVLHDLYSQIVQIHQ